jgi:hypothetical protein
MNVSRAIHHIQQVAKCPSFSTYEERLHPYILQTFDGTEDSEQIECAGNNLIFRIGNEAAKPTIAIAAHLDKINHYGKSYPEKLPMKLKEQHIEGAMDDSAGVGLLLALAEASAEEKWPNLLFFFSEMEESKGLREHPQLLKNEGEGYIHGMGSRRIAHRCQELRQIPETIITIDTTPLFKGESGIAIYAKHWDLNDLEATKSLKKKTKKVISSFQAIDPQIELHNNTNDYLHYGYEFNHNTGQDVVSIALESSINPYHQKGEQVFIRDIRRLYRTMITYFNKNK